MDTPLPDLAGRSPMSSDALGALSRILYASDDFDEVFDRHRHWPRCASSTAATTRASCSAAATAATRPRVSTDDIARSIDKLEQLHQQGPCLDAIVEDAPQFEDDLSDPYTQWPALAEQVVRQTPVRSAAGFRIIVGEARRSAP